MRASARFTEAKKKEKYPVNAFVIEKEEWENRKSCMLFGFYKSVDYPKYTSLRILPFYYNLKSKIDNREKTLRLLTFYSRVDGDDELTVNPFRYYRVNKYEYERSVFYLFWCGK